MLAIPLPNEGVVHGRRRDDLGEAAKRDTVNRPQDVTRHPETIEGLVDIVLVYLVASTRADCEEEGEALVAIHLYLGTPTAVQTRFNFFQGDSTPRGGGPSSSRVYELQCSLQTGHLSLEFGMASQVAIAFFSNK